MFVFFCPACPHEDEDTCGIDNEDAITLLAATGLVDPEQWTGGGLLEASVLAERCRLVLQYGYALTPLGEISFEHSLGLDEVDSDRLGWLIHTADRAVLLGAYSVEYS